MAALTHELLQLRKNELASMIIDGQFKKYPELESKWGGKGREKCLQDTIYHLSYLEEAIRFETPEIFTSYLKWVQVVLEARNVPLEDLLTNVDLMQAVVQRIFTPELSKEIGFYIEKGREELIQSPFKSSSFLSDSHPLTRFAIEYLSLLLKGKKNDARQIILDVCEAGYSFSEIHKHIFKATQYEIGRLWQINKITVAQEHYCTAVSQSLLASLYSCLFIPQKKKGKIVACSIGGDLHEFGIRLLTDEFEIQGWDSYYMGANMPDENIISAATEQQAQLLAVSVTMPFHLSRLKSLIDKIRANDQLSGLKILVGGHPFNLSPDLAFKLGADATASGAEEAISIAEKWISLN